MTLPLKPFYFMRHGETDWNKQHRGMGQQDIPLNDKGIEQAYDAAEILKDISFASIAVSPLERALKTAQILGDKINVPLTVIDDLKECSWGVMEGTCKGDGKWLQEWRKGGAIEGAELFSEFSKRIIKGMQEALDLPSPVLIVKKRK